MGKKYLIDSNVLIEYLGQVFPVEISVRISSIIDGEFNISFVNKIEVLGHSSASKAIDEFIEISNIYYIDNDVVQKIIELRKTSKIKLPDAIIAATAIVNNFILLTRNIADFKNIKELKSENPWDWQRSER